MFFTSLTSLSFVMCRKEEENQCQLSLESFKSIVIKSFDSEFLPSRLLHWSLFHSYQKKKRKKKNHGSKYYAVGYYWLTTGLSHDVLLYILFWMDRTGFIHTLVCFLVVSFYAMGLTTLSLSYCI